MAVKKFTPKAQNSKRTPIKFELYEEQFEAVPHLQGITMIHFIEATSNLEGSEESSAGIVSEIMPFFKAALVPESYERFKALTKSHDKVLEIDDLMDILSWLIQEYTDRPTSGSNK